MKGYFRECIQHLKSEILSGSEIDSLSYEYIADAMYFSGNYWKYKNARAIQTRQVYQRQINDSKRILLTKEWSVSFGHLTLISFIIRAINLGLYPNIPIILLTADHLGIHPILYSYGTRLETISVCKVEYHSVLQDLSQYAYLHEIDIWPLRDAWPPMTLDEAISCIIMTEYERNGVISSICDSTFIKDVIPTMPSNLVAYHNRSGYTHGIARVGRNTTLKQAIDTVNILTKNGYIVVDIDSQFLVVPDSEFYGQHPSKIYRDGICENRAMRSYVLLSFAPFYVGSQSGPLTLRHALGKSFVLYNNTLIGAMSGLWMPNSYMLPKIWFDTRTDEYVPLRHILLSPMGWSELAKYGQFSLRDCPSIHVLEAISQQTLFAHKWKACSKLALEQSLNLKKIGGIGSLMPTKSYVRSYWDDFI